MQFILDQIPSFDQFTSAAAGYALGILTAIWAHALWKWWHPHTIRYWAPGTPIRASCSPAAWRSPPPGSLFC